MIRQIYLGWDSREPRAFEVAAASIAQRAKRQVAINRLVLDVMVDSGRMWRRTDRDGIQRGSLWDVVSHAPMSTEFALTRFMVPMLQHHGWALFADCDVVALADIEELFELADDRFALMCVQHDQRPIEMVKMDGQPQTAYARKNWSSVVLWNCSHPAHKRLDVMMLNTWPGDLLHRFSWLRDSEIGALPAEWNWLVGVQPKPAQPKLAHFTLGGPWLRGWESKEHDEIWNEAARLIDPRAAA